MALPVACGKGITSTRRDLPFAMRKVPAAQSMSSKLQADDLAAAQTQVDDAAHDGVGAKARWQLGREGIEQLFDLGTRQRLRKRRQAPTRR